MNYFYMDEQSREIGPVSLETLRSVRAAGVIKDHTLVRPENQDGPWAASVSVLGAGETPPATSAAQLEFAAKVTEAIQHAKVALRGLITNPVGGLAPMYQQLGKTRSGEAGLVFLGASVAIFMAMVYTSKTFLLIRPTDFGGFLKLLVTTLACNAAWAGALFVARVVNRRDGSLAGETLIAGSMSLIWSGVILLITVLGFGNIELMLVVCFTAGCVAVLQVFVGLTKIGGLDDRTGTIMVPLVLLAGLRFCKIILSAFYGNQLISLASESFKGILK